MFGPDDGGAAWAPGWRLSPREVMEMYIEGDQHTRRQLDRYLDAQREEAEQIQREWLWPAPPDFPCYERQSRWSGQDAHDPIDD